MADPIKTLFSSRYAMASGKITPGQYHDRGDGYARNVKDRSFDIQKIGRDVHETREEAVKAAEAMRSKKIASLEKQIAKLRKMEF
jgi:hypothetical protein